jgi:hypothetical protein
MVNKTFNPRLEESRQDPLGFPGYRSPRIFNEERLVAA